MADLLAASSASPRKKLTADSLVSAGNLLREAIMMLDAPGSTLLASASGKCGFTSGALWMRDAMHQRRGERPVGQASFNYLGLIKYTLATAAATVFIAIAFLSHRWFWMFFSLPAFYVVEAQMVFLFPLALDAEPHLFVSSLKWTQHAGGTIAVMRIVLPIALVMLLGGFAGKGFRRCWCAGCLAVVIWYECLRACNAAPRIID